MKKRLLVRTGLCLLLLSQLSGCGLKGPLYMPKEPAPEKPQQAEPAPAKDAPAN